MHDDVFGGGDLASALRRISSPKSEPDRRLLDH
jgi:hypothetical protein